MSVPQQKGHGHSLVHNTTVLLRDLIIWDQFALAADRDYRLRLPAIDCAAWLGKKHLQCKPRRGAGCGDCGCVPLGVRHVDVFVEAGTTHPADIRRTVGAVLGKSRIPVPPTKLATV